MTATPQGTPAPGTPQIFHGSLPHSVTQPQPRIECFPAPGNADDIGLVVFPGGGYCALVPHEGRAYAEWFQPHGITCFLTEYRLGIHGHHHPAMLEDAAAAISTVRARQGSRWNLSSTRAARRMSSICRPG